MLSKHLEQQTKTTSAKTDNKAKKIENKTKPFKICLKAV